MQSISKKQDSDLQQMGQQFNSLRSEFSEYCSNLDQSTDLLTQQSEEIGQRLNAHNANNAKVSLMAHNAECSVHPLLLISSLVVLCRHSC